MNVDFKTVLGVTPRITFFEWRGETKGRGEKKFYWGFDTGGDRRTVPSRKYWIRYCCKKVYIYAIVFGLPSPVSHIVVCLNIALERRPFISVNHLKGKRVQLSYRTGGFIRAVGGRSRRATV